LYLKVHIALFEAIYGIKVYIFLIVKSYASLNNSRTSGTVELVRRESRALHFIFTHGKIALYV